MLDCQAKKNYVINEILKPIVCHHNEKAPHIKILLYFGPLKAKPKRPIWTPKLVGLRDMIFDDVDSNDEFSPCHASR